MKVLRKILNEYTVQVEHFVDRTVEMQGINFGKAAKPSGFQLMTSFLNDTPVLRMTLSIIDEVEQLLETFIANEGKLAVFMSFSSHGECFPAF